MRNVTCYTSFQVGAENVHSALSLITYDGQLQRAMEYVFGNTFICKDLNVAKQVAFHDRILKRCVTLDGDVVEPAGTLSGGARQKGGSLLLQLEEILQCEVCYSLFTISLQWRRDMIRMELSMMLSDCGI